MSLKPNVGSMLNTDGNEVVKYLESMSFALDESLSVLVYPSIGAWSNNIDTSNSWHMGNMQIQGTENSIKGFVTEDGFDVSDGHVIANVDGNVDKTYIIGFKNNVARNGRVILMIDNILGTDGSTRLESTHISVGEHHVMFSNSYNDGLSLVGGRSALHNYSYHNSLNCIQEILYIAEYDRTLSEEEMKFEQLKLMGHNIALANSFDGINMVGFPNTRPRTGLDGTISEYVRIDTATTDIFLVQPNREYEIRHTDGIDMVFVDNNSETDSLGMIIVGSYLRINPSHINLPCKVKEVR